ncbi:MAG: Peptidylprolyl isomerase [Acidobacteria bacterium]|jgi:cyclophilin family peptidyl-prolyl cis-trans isomerase|nr:Peptidylprolyl isomerase [Acidobacteriota bacterium]
MSVSGVPMRVHRRALLVGSVLLILSAVVALPLATAQTAATGPVVVMKTSLGEIRIQLDQDKAPVSVKNFLAYVNKKHYDGTVFHRVISTFMIQGGGFTAAMEKKPTGQPIKNEAQNGLKNVRGSVAMARTADPNSATCQFFINVIDNPGLDYPKPDGHGYAVFGQVVAGMDVVDKIKAVAVTTTNGMQNVPVSPVVIESVRLASQ